MNLLLAAVLLMQDKTAEDSFNKIEEQILRSKTLRVEFILSTEDGGKKRASPGSLLLKEGNKVHFSMDTGETLGPQKLVATALCDGTMMLQAYGPLGRSDEAVPTFNLA